MLQRIITMVVRVRGKKSLCHILLVGRKVVFLYQNLLCIIIYIFYNYISYIIYTFFGPAILRKSFDIRAKINFLRIAEPKNVYILYIIYNLRISITE